MPDRDRWTQIMNDNTLLVSTGRPHDDHPFPVNPPVERASTFLFPSYEDFIKGSAKRSYGRHGTSTHRALEETITALEGGHETALASSGLQACIISILAFTGAGDHILVTDNVYEPTRRFSDTFLKRFGIETTYFNPLCTADELGSLMRDNTKVVFAESPGSLTFEIHDLPALAGTARENGAVLVVDNSWSGGYFHKPLLLGADVSIQAGTKYLAGHADCLIGSIASASARIAAKIRTVLTELGANVSADDASLALRGMRTLSARLEVHQRNALGLARFLDGHDRVRKVLHPAFENCPGHAFWKRDFTGSSGLFSIILEPVEHNALKQFFNTLEHFGMGYSWGGFESLCLPVAPDKFRTVSRQEKQGPVLRFHAGLESPDDLQMDLERAFRAME